VILTTLGVSSGGFLGANALLAPTAQAGASAAPALAHQGAIAYVTRNDGTITKIDTVTRKKVGAPINLDGASGDGIAITPDAKHLYIARPGDGTVTVMSTATGASDSIPFVEGSPRLVAIAPDGAVAYVADSSNDVVYLIDTSNGDAFDTIGLDSSPQGIAVSPDGNSIYLTEPSGGEGYGFVERLDWTGEGYSHTFIEAQYEPTGIAVTPDGSSVYVANRYSDSVTHIDTSDNTTSTIELPSFTDPSAIAILPDGSTVYVGGDNGTVTPISTADDSVGDPTSVPGLPRSLAATPDGRSVYVGSISNIPSLAAPATCCEVSTTAPPSAGKVVVISVDGNSVVATINTGGADVNGIAIMPDQAPVARLAVAPGPVNSPSEFDASASTSASSPIDHYTWDFGDGDTDLSYTPVIEHVYSTADNFTATVTVTDEAGTSTEQVFTGQTMSRNGGPSAVASRDITVTECPAGESCTASASDGDQSVTVEGTSSTNASLSLSMGVATVACVRGETPKPREVVGLNPENFTSADGLHASITFQTIHELVKIPICYSGTKPFRTIHGGMATQGIIPHCHTDPPVSIPCQASFELVEGNLVEHIIVPASDPKFWAKTKIRIT
jgi:YVTN family beta-propeller protein